jgi:hypothetical protein
MIDNLDIKNQAIRNIHNEVTLIQNGDPSKAFSEGGDEVLINISLVEIEVTRLQAEYEANAYARSRATAYPSLADQADMQFHDAVDGTTTWQDAIQAVKDANPKP